MFICWPTLTQRFKEKNPSSKVFAILKSAFCELPINAVLETNEEMLVWSCFFEHPSSGPQVILSETLDSISLVQGHYDAFKILYEMGKIEQEYVLYTEENYARIKSVSSNNIQSLLMILKRLKALNLLDQKTFTHILPKVHTDFDHEHAALLHIIKKLDGLGITLNEEQYTRLIFKTEHDKFNIKLNEQFTEPDPEYQMVLNDSEQKQKREQLQQILDKTQTAPPAFKPDNELKSVIFLNNADQPSYSPSLNP